MIESALIALLLMTFFAWMARPLKRELLKIEPVGPTYHDELRIRFRVSVWPHKKRRCYWVRGACTVWSWEGDGSSVRCHSHRDWLYAQWTKWRWQKEAK